jgi:hypothetical protein
MRRRDLLGMLAPATMWAAQDPLSDEDSRAFDEYCEKIESGLKRGARLDWSPALRASLAKGDVAVSAMTNPNPRHTGKCYIHDWAAAALGPRGKAAELAAVLQDFGRHKTIYSPDVADSRLISRDGDVYRSFMRVHKKKLITVVLNCEYETRFQIEEGKGRSYVHSTRIVEVEKPGTRDETETPPGHGFGFLWRMNSYWRWEEISGGLFIELRSVSLSREVPAALAWAVNSIITSMPRESLVFSLDRTRQALR